MTDPHKVVSGTFVYASEIDGKTGNLEATVIGIKTDSEMICLMVMKTIRSEPPQFEN